MSTPQSEIEQLRAESARWRGNFVGARHSLLHAQPVFRRVMLGVAAAAIGYQLFRFRLARRVLMFLFLRRLGGAVLPPRR